MEGLFTDNKLGELEEKVDVLIRSFRGVREEKERLQGRVESLENENKQLKERMATLQDEKEVVMHKIKNILEKVQKIDV